MRKNILLVFICLSATVFAQKKDDIVQRGIQVQRSYEQNIKNGDKEPFLEKEEFFNFQGELIEIKEYTDEGKNIKSWFKYKYDEQANLIEEQELTPKGEQIIRIEYIFQKGLKIEKLTYDDKNRLEKRKVYKYGYRK